ncbi:hypothetical protein I4U23_014316 [Adineta vaga]|nr:hypothetical protein I4U23_014316 [Adineta vaga]
MCEQTKRYFSPRLLDYVIIVGCRHPNKYNHVTQTPELLRRYPLEDHKDFALPPDVIFFCQPEGFRQITSFVFTLTEKDSNRQRFGICMNFYRHFSRRACSIHNPNQQKSDATDAQKEETDESDPTDRKRKRRLRNNTLTSICLISHHPFFTRFRECLGTLKTIIDACNERSCAKRTGASKGTSRETVWGVLTGQACECTSNLVGHEVREIETWILRLLSAPVSIPGKTKILIETLSNEPPMLFALPDHTRFSLVDFPLHLPLELLGVDLCIRVLTLIMLENKVVFQSRDYNALTMSVLAFVALLYPLEYMFPVIPLLPTCMTGAEQLLLIPTPFIIGVPASFFPYKGMSSTQFDDIWIVDLDANQIIQPRQAEPFFDIPEFEYNILSNHLKQALGSMSIDPEPVQSFDAILNDKSYIMTGNNSIPLPSTSYNPFIYGNDVDSVDIATRVAMVRFFNSPNIMGNFNEHTRTLRLHPRAVVAFQYSSFVRSRPVKSAYIIRVEFFAEWSLCPDNVAFLRVQTGVYDPALIGDKPKWYSRNLTSIPFNIIEENSTLGQAVDLFKSKVNDVEHTPTDESGSDSEEDSGNPDYSSLSEFVSEMRNSEICGEIRVAKIYPENQEKTACVEYSTVYSPPEELQIPDEASNQMPSPNASGNESSHSISESTVSSSTNSQANSGLNSPSEEMKEIISDPSNALYDIDSKSSSATITPITKNFPKPLFDSKTLTSGNNSAQSSPPENHTKNVITQGSINQRVSAMMTRTDSHDSNTNAIVTKTGRVNKVETENATPTNASLFQQVGEEINSTTAGRVVSNMAKMATHKMSELLSSSAETPRQSITSMPRANRPPPFPFPKQTRKTEKPAVVKHGAATSNASMLARQQSVETKANTHSENQQFLKDIVTNVLDGQGIGWLKINRVKKLMEDENYRNFVLSRLNVNLDKKYSDEDDYIEDTKISRAVFKGMTNILRAVIQGLEVTFENNGLGGMASTFQLLEIAHTHYWIKDSKNDLSPMSERNSPLNGSRESLASIDPNIPSNIPTISSQQQQQQQQQQQHQQHQQQNNATTPNTSLVAQLDSVQVNGNEYQNIDVKHDPKSSNNAIGNNKKQSSTIENQVRPDSLTLTNETTPKPRMNIPRINSVITDDDSGTDSGSSSRRQSKINHHHIRTSNQWTDEKSKTKQLSHVATPKSSFSAGYRFRNGLLQQTTENNSSTINDKQYLFEVLIGSTRSHLWDQMQVWEDVFLDAVAQERDIIGLDQGPAEMMERYYSLSNADRKRLELDEDRLLAVMLYNLIAFMILMRVSKEEIRRKVRRILGRCHIGLTMSQQVNELLDNIASLNGNDVDLRPVGSRLLQKQSFTVHWGTDNTGDMLFMEVWDDCIILRSVLGEVYDRCWFEKLVNMTFCPKTKVLCLWRKADGETQLNKFYTKRCRDLYFSIKEAMEKAASRMKGSLPGQELGGEFPIKDISTSEGGILQVCLEGICLTFENDKEFIELQKIRKCTTQKGDIFVLEEFDPNTKQILIRKYKSPTASNILLAFHRVVSIVVERRKLASANIVLNGNNQQPINGLGIGNSLLFA